MLAVRVPDGYMIWNHDVTTWRDVACDVGGRNLKMNEKEEFGSHRVPYRATCEQFPVDR